MAGQLVATRPRTDLNIKFRLLISIFLAIPLLVLALTIVSETTGSDLSNGVGLVSAYALVKKL